MKVSVCYALPQQQYLEEVDVAEGSKVEEVIHASRLLELFPSIDLSQHKLGVFAKLVKVDTELHDGDRIEIYRALPRKPRNAHDVDEKKARIRAKKESRRSEP